VYITLSLEKNVQFAVKLTCTIYFLGCCTDHTSPVAEVEYGQSYTSASACLACYRTASQYIFKNMSNDNMATIQNMLGQGCTNPRCHVVWVTKFCILVPNVYETCIKKRSRITVCIQQLYLTCKTATCFGYTYVAIIRLDVEPCLV
jgi:hypothetical protein